MSQQLANGKQQFIDGNGNPLAGGSVYFYLPGTLTPTNTWQDQGLTTLNANPVVLDANGEAVIWGAYGFTYRQILKDSLGNTVWDEVVGMDVNGYAANIQNQSYTYGLDTGTANTYAVALSPDPTALVDGMSVTFRALNTNTGASTLNLNGLGAVGITANGNALGAGQIVAGGDYDVTYSSAAAAWLLMAQSVGAVSASNATVGTQELVPISQADLRYTLSGADGSAPLISVAAGGTITLSEVGNRFLLNGAATLPTPAGNGGVEIWCKNANVASTLTTPAGLIYTSDGGNAATTWAMPASTSAWAIFISDGTNWSVQNIGGRTVVANAVNANEAVALGQSLAGATSSQNIASSRAYGTVYTNSTSRTRLVKMSSTNVSATIQLSGYVNGNLVDTGLLAAGTAGGFVQITLFVPPGATYEVTSDSGGSAINSWQETT